jgi:murein DD-endopeptidase MepM/ murein hydrolase activator NlpD
MPVQTTHEVKPGDTLSKIAAKYGLGLPALLAANQQISNPDLIMIGQLIKIPTATTTTTTTTPVTVATGTYDGDHPAPGTISTNRASLIYPPLTNAPGARSKNVLDQLINQFAVGNNPRYLPGGGYTYCNIFLWDVTRALGAEIPHWVNAAGKIATPHSSGAYEVNINGGVDWMKDYGVPAHGWRASTADEAQDYANAGKVAVVMWKNPTGHHGHTAVIRPGEIDSKGPATAQAGSINFNMGHMKDGFGNIVGQYYVHD